MNDQATICDPPPAGRVRAFHYLIIRRDWSEYDPDTDDGGGPEPYVADAYDDRDKAIEDASWASIEDTGVWDNWAGSWALEPSWADEVIVTATGWSRLDLRPAEAGGL